MAQGVDPAVGAKRHHQQCCGPVGARSTHTATLAWRKIRPVTLTEALVKLAEGVMIDAVFNRLATIFKAQQFSVRTPGGAKAVIGALPQRSTKDPRGAIVVTDLTSAYGCMSRQCALQAVRNHCPRMLGILCTQWERGSTTAWLQTRAGWISWYVERGTWQGAPAANPTFCLALHHAISETKHRAEKGCNEEENRRWRN